MTGRDGNKPAPSGRRLLVGIGAGAGAFLAAAMATGSAVTAAPAHADFEDLIDPIIQPLLTHVADSIGAFDPAAALDLTNWTDHLLAGLGSIDLAVPSVAEPAASALAPTADAAAATGGTIPLTVLEGTEPAVYATIGDGSSSVPLLVDTGSSGLVVPESDLGANNLWQLLLDYGFPSHIGESGYSGGVDYLYMTFNNVPVDYGDGALSTTGPVDVEFYSWEPGNFGSLFTNDAFQNFLSGNDVSGILGIGENTAGPTTSPFESFGGVTVDIPGKELIVGSDAPIIGTTVNGAPIASLYETVTNGGTVSGGSAVSDDVDSGGVYGTIPSSLASDVAPGSVISVYTSEGGTLLYQYTVQSGELPTATSGTSIDSGVEPFLTHAIYINYADNTMTIGPSIN
ncbi:PecA family PE domain-processing aspartic protease [Mycobacterium sp.]|uniref:PecA family PE domain-processing aspartic protease n=1 Tax=Mycobacterium sp. TaxID=1785 RepID=UPI003BB00D2F